MAYQLFATFKKTSALAIVILLSNSINCWGTEYVFTAPPEIGQDTVEVPPSDREYPLYECATEAEADETNKLDSHECSCIDCERSLEEQSSEQDEQLDSKNKQN